MTTTTTDRCALIGQQEGLYNATQKAQEHLEQLDAGRWAGDPRAGLAHVWERPEPAKTNAGHPGRTRTPRNAACGTRGGVSLSEINECIRVANLSDAEFEELLEHLAATLGN